MPRTSSRRKAIRKLEKQLSRRIQLARARELHGEIDLLENGMDECMGVQLVHMRAQRYTTRKKKYRQYERRWPKVLYDREYLNDAEFLEHFRVSRPAFHRLVKLIEDDHVFQPGPWRTFKGPVELHLLIMLNFLTCYGNENTSSKLGKFLGLSKGSVPNYVARTVEALVKLYDSVVTWPDAEERRTMAKRIQEKYGFQTALA